MIIATKDRFSPCISFIYRIFWLFGVSLHIFRELRADISNNVNFTFKELINKDKTLHILFWLLLYVFLVIIDYNEEFMYTLVKEAINITFFAAIVYTNLLYIIPNYLTNKNIFYYLVVLSVLAAVLTPIKTLALVLISYGDPSLQSSIRSSQAFIFLSSLFIGASSTIYHISSEWLTHQREKKELQNQTLQSELRFLKSQINPHFLFNTLNSLYALTLKKSDLAPEIVLKLSEMMRYMLYECNEKEVPLQKELNYIENYLELEKIRHGDKCNIKFSVKGDAENKYIAPLMFIPFIENSFKHGLNNSIDDAYVDIAIDIVKAELQMQIDNSKGHTVPTQYKKRSGGIGLVNIKRRLELLYPGKYLLDIRDNPSNYLVNLSIQLI